MIKLIDLKLNAYAKIVSIDNNLSVVIVKRLRELGFVRGNRVKLLYKNPKIKAGIVAIYSSPLSLDYTALSNIWVEEIK